MSKQKSRPFARRLFCFEWLHFGSTLVAATAKETLCPSTKSPKNYDNENGQNDKRFHSWFLMLVATTSALPADAYLQCVHSVF